MARRWPTSRSTSAPATSSPNALFGALDAGQVVNPAAVEAQIIGQMIQAVEPHAQGGGDVRQERRHQPRLGVVSGAALRRASGRDVPVVVQRLDEPSSGAGEEVMGATDGRDRQRVLRRDRRAAAAISDDARAGEGRACSKDVAHVPENACPALDAGWTPVFRKGHAPTQESHIVGLPYCPPSAWRP